MKKRYQFARTTATKKWNLRGPVAQNDAAHAPNWRSGSRREKLVLIPPSPDAWRADRHLPRSPGTAERMRSQERREKLAGPQPAFLKIPIRA